ncbi:uncharacterized protein [Triticum aestivum]|uniref:uncharacterized protein n=1 Tax=Triticum aestivum TaxID=4565 RepID=UPI001D025E5B|nr:uncharacterized protein LOC123074833 [Triticum aestivum]
MLSSSSVNRGDVDAVRPLVVADGHVPASRRTPDVLQDAPVPPPRTLDPHSPLSLSPLLDLEGLEPPPPWSPWPAWPPLPPSRERSSTTSVVVYCIIYKEQLELLASSSSCSPSSSTSGTGDRYHRSMCFKPPPSTLGCSTSSPCWSPGA